MNWGACRNRTASSLKQLSRRRVQGKRRISAVEANSVFQQARHRWHGYDHASGDVGLPCGDNDRQFHDLLSAEVLEKNRAADEQELCAIFKITIWIVRNEKAVLDLGLAAEDIRRAFVNGGIEAAAICDDLFQKLLDVADAGFHEGDGTLLRSFDLLRLPAHRAKRKRHFNLATDAIAKLVASKGKPPFDVNRDFAAVIMIAYNQMLLASNPALPTCWNSSRPPPPSC